jgi:hypothetical protein
MNDGTDARNKLLNELEALLDQLKDLTDKGLYDESKFTPELISVMTQLEVMAKDFQSLSDVVIAESGISRDELLQRLSGTSDEISPETKRFVNRGDHLKQKAQKAMESLHMPLDAVDSNQLTSLPSKSDFEKVQEKKRDKSNKKRSRKFKSLDDKHKPI